MKIEKHIRIRTKGVKLGANKAIENIKKAIRSGELKRNNIKTKCTDKNKQNLGAYDTKAKEKTLSTSEMKENTRDGHICIYECGKNSVIQHMNG